jgi:hypothetical protein
MVNGRAFVDNVIENLITDFPNWNRIKNQLSQGSGGSLNDLHRIYSSAALCVNNFAPFEDDPNLTKVFEYSGLTSASFEKKISTGLKGTPPNLDVFLESQDVIIGIESKYLETLEISKEHTNKNLEKSYLNRKELSYLPDSFNELIEHYVKIDKEMYLDAAQLIKHSIGLINEAQNSQRKAVLFYIYWRPRNHEDFCNYAVHSEELEEFAIQMSKLNNSIEFQHMPYDEFWRKYKNDPVLGQHFQRVQERYWIDVSL